MSYSGGGYNHPVGDATDGDATTTYVATTSIVGAYFNVELGVVASKVWKVEVVTRSRITGATVQVKENGIVKWSSPITVGGASTEAFIGISY